MSCTDRFDNRRVLAIGLHTALVATGSDVSVERTYGTLPDLGKVPYISTAPKPRKQRRRNRRMRGNPFV